MTSEASGRRDELLLAWGAVAAMVAAAWTSFTAELAWAAILLVAGLAAVPRRLVLACFAAATIGFQAIALGLFLDGDPAFAVGPVQLSSEGLRIGAAAGTRLAAAIAANLALVSRLGAARLLDGLGLPARATALAAAVLITARDAGRDLGRLVDGRRADGAWPSGLGRIRAAASLAAPLLALVLRRAERRAEALRLAGQATGPRFAPLVAVAALAVAARVALPVLPNVSLAYVVVFLGGLLFGWRVGVGAAVLAMALTDLALSGLAPQAFVNVPAMALVGLCGAALRGLDLEAGDRLAGRLLAGSLGFFLTLLFSVASDVTSWLLVPETRSDVDALRVLVLLGLAFNAVPAVVNGLLFAWTVGPAQRALRATSSAARPTP